MAFGVSSEVAHRHSDDGAKKQHAWLMPSYDFRPLSFREGGRHTQTHKHPHTKTHTRSECTVPSVQTTHSVQSRNPLIAGIACEQPSMKRIFEGTKAPLRFTRQPPACSHSYTVILYLSAGLLTWQPLVVGCTVVLVCMKCYDPCFGIH